jgi:hypothetical protein
MRSGWQTRALYLTFLFGLASCSGSNSYGGGREDGGSSDGGSEDAAGSSPDAGSHDGEDAATGDAQVNDGGAGGGDAAMPGDLDGGDAATPSGLSLYVDPAAGDDVNPGTREMPLRTIAYAASLAADGDTIWLLDGTYDGSTETRFTGTDAAPCGSASGIVLPTGVTVRAENPGAAVLSVSGPSTARRSPATAGAASISGTSPTSTR